MIRIILWRDAINIRILSRPEPGVWRVRLRRKRNCFDISLMLIYQHNPWLSFLIHAFCPLSQQFCFSIQAPSLLTALFSRSYFPIHFRSPLPTRLCWHSLWVILFLSLAFQLYLTVFESLVLRIYQNQTRNEISVLYGIVCLIRQKITSSCCGIMCVINIWKWQRSINYLIHAPDFWGQWCWSTLWLMGIKQSNTLDCSFLTCVS